MAVFKVVTGVMGAGKSAQAIIKISNLRIQGLDVLVLKSLVDTRDKDAISSRIIKDEVKVDYMVPKDASINDYINRKYDYIIVDEAHMLSKNQVMELYNICLERNINVILYGLRMSWKGIPLESMQLALGYAEEVEFLNVVDKDNHLITHHIKLINGIPADINLDEDEICPGDVSGEEEVTYVAVSKQTFYNVYKYRVKK